MQWEDVGAPAGKHPHHFLHWHFESSRESDYASDRSSADEVEATSYWTTSLTLNQFECPRGEQSAIAAACERKSLKGCVNGPGHGVSLGRLRWRMQIPTF